MKRFLMAGLLAGVLSTGLLAQAPTTDVRATVPFNFWLAGKLMPAGDYSVAHGASGLIVVRQDGGAKETALFLASQISRPLRDTDGKLEFNRYGDTYFLSKIWLPYNSQGSGVRTSAREKEVARMITQRGSLAVATK
jgi:hypothetical protein